MASYLVAYDLIKEKEHDYERLWDELKSLKAQKTQFSLWLVPSLKTAQGLHDLLKQYMHEKDRLWVCEMMKDRYTYSQAISGTNKWIENNPPRKCA